MRIKRLAVRGYRSFSDRTEVPIEPLTALVGQNDAGKSSLLTALGAFLAPSEFKIDATDFCKLPPAEAITIEVTFEAPTDELVLDDSARTTLQDEFLLDKNGDLTLGKEWRLSGEKIGSPQYYALAHHPSTEKINDLLSLKITDLRKRAEELGIEKNKYKANTASSIRRAIWKKPGLELQLEEQYIYLKSEAGKDIWSQLEARFPLFALFRADRPSLDTDEEAQDPLTLAVRQALKDVEPDLAAITDRVKEAVTDVAKRTLEKLRDTNPQLADELHPSFATLAWDKVFKIGIVDQNGIPINKKGSGTRRQILISFFRAEAERSARERGSGTNIVYAIEEPETAQHPDNQKRMFEALSELAASGEAQVLLTTHVPALAALLPTTSIRYVVPGENIARVQWGQQILDQVALALGVHADLRLDRVRVVVVVEGRNDVSFLTNVSATLCTVEPSKYVALGSIETVLILTGGGSNLKDWVERNALSRIGVPCVYIFDRDMAHGPNYVQQAAIINSRNGRSQAFVTSRREIENYIHPDVIRDFLIREHGFDPGPLAFSHDDDVPLEIAKRIHEHANPSRPWDALPPRDQKDKQSRVKLRLNTDCTSRMTFEQIDDEIKEWIATISELARRSPTISP